MMPVVIRPAAPTFDSSGTPFSQEFADVYHSAASGPGQSRHVFRGVHVERRGVHRYTDDLLAVRTQPAAGAGVAR